MEIILEDGFRLSDDPSDFVLLSEAVPDAILEIRWFKSSRTHLGNTEAEYQIPSGVIWLRKFLWSSYLKSFQKQWFSIGDIFPCNLQTVKKDELGVVRLRNNLVNRCRTQKDGAS